MKEERKRITIGVLGTGYWGTKLCKEYASIENSEEVNLAYVADPYEAALTKIKRDLDNPNYRSDSTKFVSDYREVFDDSIVDAVHLAIPNELHYQVAREALERGRHVLLEKPMAMSSRESIKLARLAEEKGLRLQVGHIFRFNNAIRKVRSLLREGAIGKVRYANLSWATFMAPPKNRDIIFDLAPHPIDILNYLLDEWPISVHAIGESYLRQRSNAEEVAMINMVFPDQVLANIYVSWIQHGTKERTLRIVGERSTIYCDALLQNVSISSGGPETALQKIVVEPNNTIRDMQQHFFERIRGHGPEFNSALVGAYTVRILENVLQSMRQNDAQASQLSVVPILS